MKSFGKVSQLLLLLAVLHSPVLSQTPDNTTSTDTTPPVVPETTPQETPPVIPQGNPLEDGIGLYKRGNYSDALQKLQASMNSEFNNPKLHYYMASCYAHLNRRDFAVREFRITFALQPDGETGKFAKQALSKLSTTIGKDRAWPIAKQIGVPFGSSGSVPFYSSLPLGSVSPAWLGMPGAIPGMPGLPPGLTVGQPAGQVPGTGTAPGGTAPGVPPGSPGQPPGHGPAGAASGKPSTFSALFFDSKSPQSRKILFVGNNITSNNQLPITLAAMAFNSKPPIEVRIGEVVKSGATLENLLMNSEAPSVICVGCVWVFVVLQEQSENLLVARDSTYRSGALFSRLIQSVGARPVIFETWCHAGKTDDQAKLKEAYLRLASGTGAIMIPAGQAFDLCRRRHPEINLYADDRHPNQLGTYLTACVFYIKFFGRTPVGLPSDLSFLDPRTREKLQIMSIKPNIALILQQLALQSESGN